MRTYIIIMKRIKDHRLLFCVAIMIAFAAAAAAYIVGEISDSGL